MSASTSHAPWSAPRAVRPAVGRRFGVSTAQGAVEWTLKRNCSITPAQLLAAYGGLCVLALGVAAVSWLQGARLVVYSNDGSMLKEAIAASFGALRGGP